MLLQITLALSLILGSTSQPTSPTEASIASPATELALCPCDSVSNVSTTPSTSPTVSKHPNTMIHGMTCMCHAGPTPAARDDYRYSPGIGAHKLHTRAATWNEARKMCNEEGGHLAIVNSLTEAHVRIFYLALQMIIIFEISFFDKNDIIVPN